MYSQKTWGGPTDPYILVKFLKNEVEDDSDPIASMIIFEWKDYDLLGVFPTADSMTVRPSSDHIITTTDSLFRKNTSATQKRLATNGAMPIKPENSS
jgi:hypothetical protein